MKIKPIAIVLALIALVGLALWTSQNESEPKDQTKLQNKLYYNVKSNGTTGLKPGNKVPDFTLKTLEGQQVSLKDYRGKKVILNFWATWCPPCRKEMPDMQKVYSQSSEENVEILAVNLRYTEKNTDSVTAFVDEHHVSFPVLLDTKGSISKEFQAVSLPTSYLIDSKGTVQKKIIGPLSQRLMKAFVKNAK